MSVSVSIASCDDATGFLSCFASPPVPAPPRKSRSRGLPSQDLGRESCTALCLSLGYELCEAFFLLPYLGVLKSFRHRDARAGQRENDVEQTCRNSGDVLRRALFDNTAI
jgi:hypothetical protein